MKDSAWLVALFLYMKIRITQIDGKLPNIALMKLSHFYKATGHEVYFEQSVRRRLFEPDYDLVFGSAIFSTSAKKVKLFRSEFPTAKIGGTGSGEKWTVEDFIGDYPDLYDYAIYPNFQHSIGFSQRGCRLRCKFCVVPEKEGKNRSMNAIGDEAADGLDVRAVFENEKVSVENIKGVVHDFLFHTFPQLFDLPDRVFDSVVKVLFTGATLEE